MKTFEASLDSNCIFIFFPTKVVRGLGRVVQSRVKITQG